MGSNPTEPAFIPTCPGFATFSSSKTKLEAILSGKKAGEVFTENSRKNLRKVGILVYIRNQSKSKMIVSEQAKQILRNNE